MAYYNGSSYRDIQPEQWQNRSQDTLSYQERLAQNAYNADTSNTYGNDAQMVRDYQAKFNPGMGAPALGSPTGYSPENLTGMRQQMQPGYGDYVQRVAAQQGDESSPYYQQPQQPQQNQWGGGYQQPQQGFGMWPGSSGFGGGNYYSQQPVNSGGQYGGFGGQYGGGGNPFYGNQMPQQQPNYGGETRSINGQEVPLSYVMQNPQMYGSGGSYQPQNNPWQQYQGAIQGGGWGNNPMSYGNFLQQTGQYGGAGVPNNPYGYSRDYQQQPSWGNMGGQPRKQQQPQWGNQGGGNTQPQPPQTGGWGNNPTWGNMGGGWDWSHRLIS